MLHFAFTNPVWLVAVGSMRLICKHVNLVEVFDGVLNALIPPPQNLQ